MVKKIILSFIFYTSIKILIFSQWSNQIKIWEWGVAYFQPNASHLFVSDTLGNLHLGWYDTSGDVYYCIRKQKFNGSEWVYDGTRYDQPESGSNYYRFSWMPTLSMDEDGRFLFIWESRQDGNFNLFGRYFDGSLLSSIFQITATSSNTWFPKSFYRNHKHHFIFLDDSTGVFNIYYSFFNSTVNTFERLTNSNVNCVNTDFFVYPNDDISIIYTKERDGYQNLYNLRRINNEWQNENLVFGISSDVYYPNLISDGFNEFILFTLFTNGLNQLYITRYLNGNWTTPKLLSDGNANIYYPTGVIKNGKIHILYVSDTYFFGDLYHLIYDFNNEKIEEKNLIAHHDTSFIMTPQVTLDKNGNVHVIYILNDETPQSSNWPNNIYWLYYTASKDEFNFSKEKPYSILKDSKNVTINFKKAQEYTVSVYNISGTLLKKFKVNSPTFIFEFSKHHSGIYFITVGNDEYIWKEKIVVIK